MLLLAASRQNGEFMKIALLIFMIVAAIVALGIIALVIVDVVREKQGLPSILTGEGGNNNDID